MSGLGLYGRDVGVSPNCKLSGSLIPAQVLNEDTCIVNRTCVDTKSSCTIYETNQTYKPQCIDVDCVQAYKDGSTNRFTCNGYNQTSTYFSMNCTYNCVCQERKTASTTLPPSGTTPNADPDEDYKEGLRKQRQRLYEEYKKYYIFDDDTTEDVRCTIL